MINLLKATNDYIIHLNRLNDKLILCAQNLKFKKHCVSHPFKDVLPKEIRDLTNCLYYLQINGMGKDDAENICKHIESLKLRKEIDIKYPRVNYCRDGSLGNILYVGKSKGKLSERFRSHLRKSPKDTYALHLETWIHIFPHLEINLFYAQIEEEDLLDEELLEYLESGLHLQVKPLLGRSGH